MMTIETTKLLNNKVRSSGTCFIRKQETNKQEEEDKKCWCVCVRLEFVRFPGATSWACE